MYEKLYGRTHSSKILSSSINSIFITELSSRFLDYNILIMGIRRLISLSTLSSLKLALSKEYQELVQVCLEISEKIYMSLLDRLWATGQAKFLQKALDQATTWPEWECIATKLDQIQGKHTWKSREQTSLYDFRLLRRRLRILQNSRKVGNMQELVHNLRSGLIRNIGGSLNPLLYQQSLVGTKNLISEYQQQVCLCLKALLHSPEYPLKRKISFFTEAKQAYGNTSLLLSGGATLGMYHLGVVKALYDQRLLPRVIAGSSAGSIIASITCTSSWQEMGQMFSKGAINCDCFNGLEAGSLWRKVKRFFREGYLMDIKVLQKFMRVNIGDLTFIEAFQKTGLVLNIAVTHSSQHDTYSLLNYLTAPHVLVWSACVASSAIPYVFPAIELLCKDESGSIVPFYPSGLKFIDGSMKADLPMQRIAELFNINTFIVSQTNPWVVPFFSEDDVRGSLLMRILKRLKRIFFMELKHWMRIVERLEVSSLISSVLGIFTQEVRGDVTICPVPSLKEYINILKNPSVEFVRRCVKKGMKRTFPKVSMLKSIMKVENAFEECFEELKKSMLVEFSDRKSKRKLTSFD